jgi:hypothetical protein
VRTVMQWGTRGPVVVVVSTTGGALLGTMLVAP